MVLLSSLGQAEATETNTPASRSLQLKARDSFRLPLCLRVWQRGAILAQNRPQPLFRQLVLHARMFVLGEDRSQSRGSPAMHGIPAADGAIVHKVRPQFEAFPV